MKRAPLRLAVASTTVALALAVAPGAASAKDGGDHRGRDRDRECYPPGYVIDRGYCECDLKGTDGVLKAVGRLAWR